MAPTVHVTLKKIQQIWNHPSLYKYRKADNRCEFCRKMLPDNFTNESAYSWYFEQGSSPLSDSVLRMLVNGNRKSLSGFIHSLASVSFTDDLVQVLNENIPNQAGITPRKNLFDKLSKLVTTSDPPLGIDSPLFRQIHLEPDEPNGMGAEAYAQLRKTVQKLLIQNTTQSITYAVMIYVLAAWLQWRIEEIPWLWDWDAVGGYLSINAPRIENHDPTEHIPFDDPSYLHRYHAYLFRSTRPQLFEEGYLTMEPESLMGAQVNLTLRYQSGDDPNHFLQRQFRGNPMLSRKDSCVYALMKDDNGAFAHLYFYYKPFNANMYFRQVLLVTKDPDHAAPLTQKIVLSHKEVPQWEIPYVEGILSDTGDLIVLTPKMLETFLDTFCDPLHYPWLHFFESDVLPMIREVTRSTQYFNCQMIRSRFLGILTELEILQITLALKSIPVPGFEREGRFQTCLENPNTHLLFR